jgi:hypothetical protein
VSRAELRAIAGVAARPPARTVEIAIEDGPYAGWRATIRLDFPTRLLIGFQSGVLSEILASLELIVIDHNFPDENGERAASLVDVDPFAGLLAIANEIGTALAAVPNR